MDQTRPQHWRVQCLGSEAQGVLGTAREQSGPVSLGLCSECHWGGPGSAGSDANIQPHCSAQSRTQGLCPEYATARRTEGQVGERVGVGVSE